MDRDKMSNPYRGTSIKFRLNWPSGLRIEYKKKLNRPTRDKNTHGGHVC